MIKETQIMHENGSYWVLDNHEGPRSYMVLKIGLLSNFSVSDSAYAHTPDGLSIAIARCDYLAKRHPEKESRP